MRGRRRRTRHTLREALALVLLFAGLFGIVGLVARPKQPPQPVEVVIDEHEALARVIRSEVGDGTPRERAAIGWAARNRAHRLRTTVVHMVCHPWCGPQHELLASLRPMSSGQAPTMADRVLADQILEAPASADPTRGADSFIEPALQDELVSQHRLGYRWTYAQLRRRWLREGQSVLGRVGRFEMWKLS